jgi:hypothetical protein
MYKLMRRLLLPTLFVALAAGGCSSSLSPLYRDYRIDDTTAPTEERLAEALRDAGWALVDPVAPNVLSTNTRTVQNWGLYRVVVSLDIVAMNNNHVRVFVHPFRQYVTGGLSKLAFMNATVRSAVLPDLNDALKERGFVPIGTPVQRDRESTEV